MQLLRLLREHWMYFRFYFSWHMRLFMSSPLGTVRVNRVEATEAQRGREKTQCLCSSVAWSSFRAPMGCDMLWP